FGTDGKLTTDFSGSEDEAYAIAIQPDGKIVLAGDTGASPSHDFALARYDVATSLVSDMRFEPASVQAGGSFFVTILGTNLNDETYFDIRFRSPGSTQDEVVLNWQQGRSTPHSITPDTAIGIWTVTGLRAHQNIKDHGGDFVSLSATLTVNP